MNLTRWLTVVLGALVASSVLFDIPRSTIDMFRTYASFYFLKYVFYPHIHGYVRSSDATTRFLAVLSTVLLGTNMVILSNGIRGRYPELMGLYL